MTAAATKPNGRGPRVPLPTDHPAAVLPLEAEPERKTFDEQLLEVQRLAPQLMRNADGQIQSRTYKYVTLDAVMEVVLPLLVDHDLLWRTFPTTHEDGSPALRYRMTHIPSGQFDEDLMKLAVEQAGPQGQGSGITYARRYALTAYLNLTVDPDDDGAAASGPVDRYAEAEAAAARSGSTVRVARPAAPAAPQTTAAPAQRSVRPITGPQKGKINALLAGLTDGEAQAIKQWALGADGPPDRAPSKVASKLIGRLDVDEGGEGPQPILAEILAAVAHGDERAQQIAQRHLVPA